MTPFASWIHAYWHEIKSGRAVVGQWIRRLYEIIVVGLQDRTYCFSAKEADRAIDFIESFCHHQAGRNDLL